MFFFLFFHLLSIGSRSFKSLNGKKGSVFLCYACIIKNIYIYIYFFFFSFLDFISSFVKSYFGSRSGFPKGKLHSVLIMQCNYQESI